MSVVISNVSPLDLPDSEQHEYVVRINNKPVIARFVHRRDEGLALCLYRAYRAVEDTPGSSEPHATETKAATQDKAHEEYYSNANVLSLVGATGIEPVTPPV